jgi:hypothetical protein
MILAGAIIAGAIVMGLKNNKQQSKQEPGVLPDKVPGVEPANKEAVSHKKAWIALTIITITLFVLSILFNAWGWYVPTAGAP